MKYFLHSIFFSLLLGLLLAKSELLDPSSMSCWGSAQNYGENYPALNSSSRMQSSAESSPAYSPALRCFYVSQFFISLNCFYNSLFLYHR